MDVFAGIGVKVISSLVHWAPLAGGGWGSGSGAAGTVGSGSAGSDVGRLLGTTMVDVASGEPLGCPPDGVAVAAAFFWPALEPPEPPHEA
jgi:hypothetical protein